VIWSGFPSEAVSDLKAEPLRSSRASYDIALGVEPTLRARRAVGTRPQPSSGRAVKRHLRRHDLLVRIFTGTTFNADTVIYGVTLHGYQASLLRSVRMRETIRSGAKGMRRTGTVIKLGTTVSKTSVRGLSRGAVA